METLLTLTPLEYKSLSETVTFGTRARDAIEDHRWAMLYTLIINTNVKKADQVNVEKFLSPESLRMLKGSLTEKKPMSGHELFKKASSLFGR